MSDDKPIVPDTNIELVFEREGDIVNKVEICKVLNAKKYLHLKNFISGKIKMTQVQSGFKDNGSPKFKTEQEIPGTASAELETETMKAYVVSFNGDKKNAYDRMMEELIGSEYNKVWEKVDELYEIEEKK